MTVPIAERPGILSALLSFLCACLVVSTSASAAPALKEKLLGVAGVRAAFTRKAGAVKRAFQAKGIPYPPEEILLLALKREKALELWARGKQKTELALVKEYALCAGTERLGPKRQPGDTHAPEGFYVVTGFQPRGDSRLALQIDYPNESDRILGKPGKLAEALSLHGDCQGAGLPLAGDAIDELYVAGLDTASASATPIAVHIFPTRLTEEGLATLEKEFAAEPALIDFWRNLRDGFEMFTLNKAVPTVLVGRTGKYRFIP